MGLINRNGTYYAEFYDASRTPKARRYSLRTKSRATARRRYVEWETAWERGHLDPWAENPWDYQKRQETFRPGPSRPCTLAEARADFIESRRAVGRTENTLRTYTEVLALTEAALGGATPLAEVRAEDLEPLLRDAALSGATRHKRFAHLRAFFRWALKEGRLGQNPLDGVEPPRKTDKIPRAVTEEELEAICEAVRRRYEEQKDGRGGREGVLLWRIPLFRFAYHTGMRASELARLRWGDVDFERRLVTIRVQKNHKEQTIPLNARAESALGGLSRGGAGDYVFSPPGRAGRERTVRTFVERASAAFREAREAAGIQRPISFHGLRHGFCTRLAEAGASAFVIQAAARHADIHTSQRYVSIANEALKDELDRLLGA